MTVSSAGRRNGPISILTVTTLFPNEAQTSHGIFVETRLRKLVESGEVIARVLAPIPWLPPFIKHASLGPVYRASKWTVRHGLEVYHPRYLVIPKVGMTTTPFTLYRSMRQSLKKILSSGHRVDILDAHYFYPDGVAAAWLAQEFELPVVITARGTDLNLIPRFSRPRSMIQRAAAAADGLITVCQALKESLIDLGISAERVTVLRNGVDLDLFHPAGRVQVRKRLGLVRRTLGSVGHLIERKGHHHVIRALTGLPDTDLVIVGSGPERRSLEGLASDLRVQDRVRFLGTIDQTQLREVYTAIDALVLASSREGWANVLLEAMACGTPVVASPVWGTPEVVSTPEAGVLMPSLDKGGVVSGVGALFSALPRREDTRRYAERFDWHSTTQGQLNLFKQILDRRRLRALGIV